MVVWAVSIWQESAVCEHTKNSKIPNATECYQLLVEWLFKLSISMYSRRSPLGKDSLLKNIAVIQLRLYSIIIEIN